MMMTMIITREVIFSLRRRGGPPDLSTRKLLAQLGCGPRCAVRRGCWADATTSCSRLAQWGRQPENESETDTGDSGKPGSDERRPRPRSRFLTDVVQHTAAKSHRHNNPSLALHYWMGDAHHSGLDWPLCHCAVAQAPPFDEHRRPLAPSKFFNK